MRSRRLATVTAVGAPASIALTMLLAGCGDNTPSTVGQGPTLPPIVTTAPVVVTVVVSTTLPEYYEVQRGDTLTEIAVAFGLPVQAIMQLNGMTDPNAIQAGQILQLPPRDIVATALPPTIAGQTAPTLPGVSSTTGPTTTTTP